MQKSILGKAKRNATLKAPNDTAHAGIFGVVPDAAV
jgi:hypothetical protein